METRGENREKRRPGRGENRGGGGGGPRVALFDEMEYFHDLKTSPSGQADRTSITLKTVQILVNNLPEDPKMNMNCHLSKQNQIK